MIHPKEEDLLDKEYKVYKYRYLVGILYFLMNVLGSFESNQFLSIQTTLEKIYSSSTYLINFATTLTNFVANIPVLFLANFIVDRYGLGISVYIGTAFMTISLWLRCISESSIISILIGQTFGSMAFAFFSAPQKVSVNWFHASERAIWTTIMVQGMSVGTGISNGISGILVPEGVDPIPGREDVYDFMLYTAIGGTIVCAFTAIFFREKPPKPPSPAAIHEKKPFAYSVKILFSTKENFLAIAGASMFLGGVICYLSTFEIVTHPLGITTKDIGTAFLVSNIPGFFGAILISRYAAKSNQLKKVTFLSASGASVALIFLYFAAFEKNFMFLLIAACFVGFFLQPILPMLLELLCEISYPAGEAVSAGMIYIVGNIVGVGTSFVIDTIMDLKSKSSGIISYLIIIGMIFFGNLFVFLSKSKFERTLQEIKSVAEHIDNNNNY